MTTIRKLRDWLIVGLATIGLCQFAWSQGQIILTSLTGSELIAVQATGPQSSVVSVKTLLAGSTTPLASTYTSTSATPGTVRDIWGTAKIGSALTMTSGNLVGVRGEVDVPAGTTVNGASYLYGAQGRFIGGGTVVSPANIAGLVGQLDVSTGTYTSGVISAGWLDMGATASASAISTGLGTAQILRLTNTTAAVIPQAIYIESYSTNMMELHSTGEGEAWHPVACTPGAVTGATGGLRITIDGVTKWIPLAATCS